MTPEAKRRLQRAIALAPDSPSAVAALIEEPAVARDRSLSCALARLPFIDPGLGSMETDAPLRCSVFGVSFGLRAMRGDQLAKRIRQFGMYERHLSAFFRQKLKPGHVFFDVGANVGYHSMLAGRLVGPTGRVVAFEPHPAMRRLLARNLADNRLANIHIDPRGVGAAGGRAGIAFDLFDSGATSIAPGPSDGATVEVVTLDQACLDHGVKPMLIKIDAEGMESDILMGGRRLFEDHGPSIVMEYCPQNNTRAAASFATALGWLRDIGYRAFFFRGHDLGACEPMPMDMLIALGEHWIAEGHIGFVDVLFTKRAHTKRPPVQT